MFYLEGSMKRSSGILLPVFSLPSPYGIGTIGKEAFDFIDFLAKAGQSYWQILPLGPASFGDSPYQCYSSFAGNPFLIDLGKLIQDGLLKKEEAESISWGSDPVHVNYEILRAQRLPLLRKAYDRFKERDQTDLKRFAQENAFWLYDYALFMAIKEANGNLPWMEWEEPLRLRWNDALDTKRREYGEEIGFRIFMEYMFAKQWDELHAYAKQKGVQIIGDLPIYLAMDSADVWADPKIFQLDERNVPRAVAGVPPDAFSEDGQLWGNPLYDWDALKKDGYGFWIRRIGNEEKRFDVLRLDHFRAFASYWAVPYGAKSAKEGRWVKGPGSELLLMLRGWFHNMSFIAEDLGILTPDVYQLMDEVGFPGMKVLVFAFDPSATSSYLPHWYERNCLCYTGTHDNPPILGWEEDAPEEDKAFAKSYLGLNDEEGHHWGYIRGGMNSVADLFIAQMQDFLGFGNEARINVPGTVEKNWSWRMEDGLLTEELAAKIRKMTMNSGRLP